MRRLRASKSPGTSTLPQAARSADQFIAVPIMNVLLRISVRSSGEGSRIDKTIVCFCGADNGRVERARFKLTAVPGRRGRTGCGARQEAGWNAGRAFAVAARSVHLKISGDSLSRVLCSDLLTLGVINTPGCRKLTSVHPVRVCVVCLFARTRQVFRVCVRAPNSSTLDYFLVRSSACTERMVFSCRYVYRMWMTCCS